MSFFFSFLGYLSFRKLSKLNNNKKIIFYSESKNYRNYFIDLIEDLKNNTNFSIIYLTSDKNDTQKIGKLIEPIYIGDNFFRILVFTFLKCDLLIMTLTDLGNHIIKKSNKCKNYLYIFHSLVSTHKSYSFEAFRNYDIVLTNGDYQKKELEFTEDEFNFPKKKIFNTGYIYLERLKKQIRNDKVQNKILFAPSWNNSKSNLFDDYAEKIVSILIKKHNLILRTHPESIKRSKIVIKNLYRIQKLNSKFEINSDLTQLKFLDESFLLITDNGGMGMEYLIYQKKPVIFINYKDKIHNINFKKYKQEPIENKFRKEFGVELELNDLINLDKKIDEAVSSFHKKIKKIDQFVIDHGIITKNQTQNAKEVILKII